MVLVRPSLVGLDAPRTLSEMLDRFFKEAVRQPAVSTFSPAVDIIEREDEYEIDLYLPGVDKDHVNIKVEGNVLTVRGERKFHQEEEKENYLVVESAYGEFERVFTLPENADPDQIKARYENGVLKLFIPKREEEKAKQIAIE